MNITISKTALSEILELRTSFLKENYFQIRYNATHERGWSDSYLIKTNDLPVGYGSIKGKEEIRDRDTVFEYYVLPPFRNHAAELFKTLLIVSGVAFIECQTNEPLLSSFMREYGKNIETTAILFGAGFNSNLSGEGLKFRNRTDNDIIFEHKHEPVGNYIIEADNTVIATGGFLLHYNFPFADIYMEVREDQWKRGVGSFLVQEVKKQCYINGRVPAARCSPANLASKATLLKAGMNIAGEMLVGSLK